MKKYDKIGDIEALLTSVVAVVILLFGGWCVSAISSVAFTLFYGLVMLIIGGRLGRWVEQDPSQHK